MTCHIDIAIVDQHAQVPSTGEDAIPNGTSVVVLLVVLVLVHVVVAVAPTNISGVYVEGLLDGRSVEIGAGGIVLVTVNTPQIIS